MRNKIIKTTIIFLAILFLLSSKSTTYAKDSDLCAQQGCTNKKYCGSYCATHDSCKLKGSCKTANYGGRKICKKPHCGNTAYSSGYCHSHDPNYDPNTCAQAGCNNKKTNGSYCSQHGTTRKSSSKKKSYRDSYDSGYDSVYFNGDYDDDRYRKDWSYASGVDDALDDWDEYGDDW